jgi:hypothetical protein
MMNDKQRPLLRECIEEIMEPSCYYERRIPRREWINYTGDEISQAVT